MPVFFNILMKIKQLSCIIEYWNEFLRRDILRDKNETLRRAQKTKKGKKNIGLRIFMFFVLVAVLVGGYGVYYYQSA